MKKGRLAAGVATAAAVAGALFFTARTARKFELLVPRDGRMVEVDGQQVHIGEVVMVEPVRMNKGQLFYLTHS